MTTYRTPTLSLEDNPVPKKTLVYFRRLLQHEFHEIAFRAFRRLAADRRLTKAILAARIGKDPATITRLLGGPSNWTLDTLSDLLVGMAIDPRTVVNAAADRELRTGAASPTWRGPGLVPAAQPSVRQGHQPMDVWARSAKAPVFHPQSAFEQSRRARAA